MYARHYRLRCRACEPTFDDDGFTLECPNKHAPALLITEYSNAKFEPDNYGRGIYRYKNWLPVARVLCGAGGTVTYQSERLSRITEMTNLWIAFNGYWPEKGAEIESTTFKELEAHSVIARIPKMSDRVFVVASAGNTAAAFARVCSINKVPCLIVIPETGLQRMRFTEPLDSCVKIVSLVGFTDYYDAITFAERVSSLDGFFPEGGVKNVARRDGLATTMLNAVEAIGQIPDYYFQAVGSGSGGIAVHEAAQRLIADGRFGRKLPRLMLSQNLPFVPIYLSWKSGRRELMPIDPNDGKKQIQQIIAHVLSNRRPPYSVRGGVFDALTESQGDMLVADNLETLYASQLFEEVEGIDIDPASAVAFATLLKAAKYGQIDRDAIVLLHITGGGWYRQALDKKLIPAKPHLQIDEPEILSEEALQRAIRLFN